MLNDSACFLHFFGIDVTNGFDDIFDSLSFEETAGLAILTVLWTPLLP